MRNSNFEETLGMGELRHNERTPMDNLHRIYERKKEIDTDAVREFYDKRARQFNQSAKTGKGSLYATVSLSEQIAVKRDVMEKETIIPLLNIQKTDSILDIGCGVGRWAESVIPLCYQYVGADYSAEMIKCCNNRFKDKGGHIRFVNTSVQELPESEFVKGIFFDIVLLIGTAIYINDQDLERLFQNVAGLLSKGGRFYIRETIGIGKRLTLDGIWSQALDSNYSAVYRTREEYLDMLNPILAVSDLLDERIVSAFDDPAKPDTTRWYAVLRKK